MEVTLEITQYCEHECEYCSSNATPEGEHLDVGEISHFLYGTEKPITRINISGGEPLAHPEFYRILQMCESITPDVRVYTNALKHIVYNTDVIREITVDANVCLTSGDKYIPENVNKVRLLKLTPHGKGADLKKPNIYMSGTNCKECDHSLLQADGKIVKAPCCKDYEILSS